MRHALILSLVLALAGCNEEETRPEPVTMTDEALGQYCQMYLADHAGPKAQVFLEGYAEPFWFSQVSDAVSYRTDPERPAPVAVVYVSDMEKAASWASPGTSNWIDAQNARFVVDSDQVGGMGLREAIPFGSDGAARAFVADHGGRIVAWDEIPSDYNHSGVQGDGPFTAPEAAPAHSAHGETAR